MTKRGRKPWTKRKEFREYRRCASCGRILMGKRSLCKHCFQPKRKNTHCIDCKNPLPKHNIYRGDLRCRSCQIIKLKKEAAVLRDQIISLYEAGFIEEEICTLVNRSWMRVRDYIRTKYPSYKKSHHNSFTHKECVEIVRKLREDGLTDKEILAQHSTVKYKKALIALNMESHYGKKEDHIPIKRIRLKK